MGPRLGQEIVADCSKFRNPQHPFCSLTNRLIFTQNVEGCWIYPYSKFRFHIMKFGRSTWITVILGWQFEAVWNVLLVNFVVVQSATISWPQPSGRSLYPRCRQLPGLAFGRTMMIQAGIFSLNGFPACGFVFVLHVLPSSWQERLASFRKPTRTTTALIEKRGLWLSIAPGCPDMHTAFSAIFGLDADFLWRLWVGLRICPGLTSHYANLTKSRYDIEEKGL
jgi:hypothetical protein